jgi:HSP20 family molecular chaperone IbpA
MEFQNQTSMETKKMAETVPIKKTKSVFDELNSMRERIMQRAFEIFDSNGHVFGRDLDDWLQADRELTWKPSIELEEKDNEFRLQIGVPGVDPKNIDIEVTAEDILLKAELRHEHEEK